MNSFSGNRMVWHYQSYMLRLWREAPDGSYRASLQATTNGDQLAFADLPTLFTFLVQLEQATPSQQDESATNELDTP